MIFYFFVFFLIFLSLTLQNCVDSYFGTKFLGAVIALDVEIVFRLLVSGLDPLCQYFYISIETHV